MDAFEATAIIVKAAIEKGMINSKSIVISGSDDRFIENNKFNAERVADFTKIVYDALTGE